MSPLRSDAEQVDLWPMGSSSSPRSNPRSSPHLSPENREMFSKLDAEAWMRNALFRAGLSLAQDVMPLIEGATGFTERRERTRRLIRDRHLVSVLVRVNRGEPVESFSEAFARVYGEAL